MKMLSALFLLEHPV